MERIYFRDWTQRSTDVPYTYGMYKKPNNPGQIECSYWNVFAILLKYRYCWMNLVHKIIALLLYAGHSGKQVRKMVLWWNKINFTVWVGVWEIAEIIPDSFTQDNNKDGEGLGEGFWQACQGMEGLTLATSDYWCWGVTLEFRKGGRGPVLVQLHQQC